MEQFLKDAFVEIYKITIENMDSSSKVLVFGLAVTALTTVMVGCVAKAQSAANEDMTRESVSTDFSDHKAA